ncbi:MarR family transcriptional regulator [Gemmiger formicilis]|uniref:MarR family winged helix-turn-helix transcriptional regulator n=1 Tax=Gemmiger formicilis TaxID=745368 RepID=UPI0019599222|nr:MarR family transcriptional regulator [Gemmiger formicilis]MBM6914152.1 MarR family transcriptional regulator [Gemmiger formicilis]
MNSLHHLWMKTYLQLNRMVLDRAAALGLSPGQPKILEFLAAQGEHEQKAIADYCEIEPATVGSILTRMEAAGLVTRRNRPGNRRSLYVSLTPRGQELAGALNGVFAEAEAQITTGLTAEERQTLTGLLEKCLQNGKGSLE